MGKVMAYQTISQFFNQHEDITQLVVGVFDYNGVLRGKRMPIVKLSSLLESGFKMALSIIQADIWGRDIDDSPLLFETGDADGQIALIDRTPLRLVWMAEPTALLIGSFVDDEGAPLALCPRGRQCPGARPAPPAHAHGRAALQAGIEVDAGDG